MDISSGLEKARKTAEDLVNEQEKLNLLLKKALDKAETRKGKILDFWEDLIDLIQMIRSYLRKEYTRTPWKTIILALAAVIYFVNPLDMIPDIVPMLGFLDDATVIAFVVNALKEDISRFKQFQNGGWTTG